MLLRFSGAFGANGSVFLPARFFGGMLGKGTPVRRVLPVAGLCRRGADSWLAEICVVFQKSAV